MALFHNKLFYTLGASVTGRGSYIIKK